MAAPSQTLPGGPTLLKAETEELTVHELTLALSELAKLNGGGRNPYLITEGSNWAICWDLSKPHWRFEADWHPCAEDALIAERDKLVKVIAAEEMQS